MIIYNVQQEKRIHIMANVQEIAEGILEMFDGASVVNSTKSYLISFLEEISYEACNEIAGAVAETLLDRLNKFSDAYCSEKQAYALAYGAIEHGIEL